ncbi:uncharacterized protein METZ01_LOCUS31672, partial [marine metagenome]
VHCSAADDRNDAAALPLQHGLGELAGDLQSPEHANAEHLFPVGVLGLKDGNLAGGREQVPLAQPSVVDQHVHRAELVHGGLVGGLDGLGIADVHRRYQDIVLAALKLF